MVALKIAPQATKLRIWLSAFGEISATDVLASAANGEAGEEPGGGS